MYRKSMFMDQNNYRLNNLEFYWTLVGAITMEKEKTVRCL